MNPTIVVAIIGAVTTIFGSVVSHLMAKNKYRDDILADGVIMLATNLEENCIPQNIMNMTVENYDDFLTERRKMMAALIQKYYERL